ncbi:hypothetical protein glysoja_003234 [Glycine soja]|nr:hypothetical protein glysoja_003234 [Glycine soja]
MVSDASKKKAAQKKVVSVAVMAGGAFKSPHKGLRLSKAPTRSPMELQRFKFRIGPAPLSKDIREPDSKPNCI